MEKKRKGEEDQKVLREEKALAKKLKLCEKEKMEEKRKLDKARLKQAQIEGRQGKVRGGKCSSCKADLLEEHIVQCVMCKTLII